VCVDEGTCEEDEGTSFIFLLRPFSQLMSMAQFDTKLSELRICKESHRFISDFFLKELLRHV